MERTIIQEKNKNEKNPWKRLGKAVLIVAGGLLFIYILLLIWVSIPEHYRYTADYGEQYHDQLVRFFGDRVRIYEKQHKRSNGGMRWKGGFNYTDDYDQWTITYSYGDDFSCPERKEIMENRNDEPLPWRQWLLNPMEDAYRHYVEDYFGLETIGGTQPGITNVLVKLDSPWSYAGDPEGVDDALDAFWNAYFAPLDGGESWPTVFQPDYDRIFTRFPLKLEISFFMSYNKGMTKEEIDQQKEAIREKTLSMLQDLIDYTGSTCNVYVDFIAADSRDAIGDYAVVGGQLIRQDELVTVSEYAEMVYEHYKGTLLD